MTFQNLKPGDRVKFLQYAGRGLTRAEYRPAYGKVVLAFPTHVVLNTGGRFGKPAVVDSQNYLSR